VPAMYASGRNLTHFMLGEFYHGLQRRRGIDNAADTRRG
jgi:hypothetical protein